MCFPLVTTPIYLLSMERYTSALFRDTTCFWTCSDENKFSFHWLHIHCHSKRLCVCWKKSFKCRYCVNNANFHKGKALHQARTNAESFEYIYFPQTEMVFVVQFLRVRCYDTTVLYWAVRWQANPHPLASSIRYSEGMQLNANQLVLHTLLVKEKCIC